MSYIMNILSASDRLFGYCWIDSESLHNGSLQYLNAIWNSDFKGILIHVHVCSHASYQDSLKRIALKLIHNSVQVFKNIAAVDIFYWKGSWSLENTQARPFWQVMGKAVNLLSRIVKDYWYPLKAYCKDTSLFEYRADTHKFHNVNLNLYIFHLFLWHI